MNDTITSLKWLWKYFKKVKLLFSSAILFYIISIVFDLSIIGIQKTIIDDVFINFKTEFFIKLLLIFILIVSFEIVFYTIYELIIEKCKSIIEISMRTDYMGKLFGSRNIQYKHERIGAVQSRLYDYIQSARFITDILPKVIGILANIILLIFVIGLINSAMILLAVVASVLYFSLARLFGDKILRKHAEVNNAKAEISVCLEESITSSKEIIAYQRHEWEMTRIKKEYANFLMIIKSELKLKNKQLFFKEPVNWFINITVLGYGGYLVISSHITIGEFVVVYQFVDRLINQLQNLYMLFTGISGHLAGIEKGIQSLSEFEGVDTVNNKIKTTLKDIYSIQFKQVSFKYSSNVVLDNINFTLALNKKNAFIGESGSGKSTLVHLLTKLYSPTKGAILVNGTSLDNISMEDWFSRISIVFQEPYFYPGTIYENLTMGNDIPDEKIYEVTRLVLIHDIIDSLPLGYNTNLSEKGINLSGGQQQRLGIARALLRNPEILILDESTSALDLETERLIQQNIDSYRKNQTTILIAHRLSTVENADVINILNHGALVDSGKHSDLSKNSIHYKSLVNHENKHSRVKVTVF